MTSTTPFDSPRSAWTRQVGDCSVLSCERPASRAGYCGAHYQRWRKTGDARPDEPLRRKQAKWGVDRCDVDGCESPSRKRGWCMKHYERWFTHGDPEHDRPQGHKRLDAQGYVLVFSGGCAPSAHEHRLMWEAKYGPLLPGQNIHHKNGDRADNRYDNLEVWDTSQPAGQRPEDKVKFALEMLRRYAPEVIAPVL